MTEKHEGRPTERLAEHHDLRIRSLADRKAHSQREVDNRSFALKVARMAPADQVRLNDAEQAIRIQKMAQKLADMPDAARSQFGEEVHRHRNGNKQ